MQESSSMCSTERYIICKLNKGNVSPFPHDSQSLGHITSGGLKSEAEVIVGLNRSFLFS